MVDRESLIEWYVRNRRRSQALFDMLADEDTYYSRPIALRHPIVFYEGHLPAFSYNTLVKGGLGGPSIDPALETLFARGIDPSTAPEAANEPATHRAQWPSRREVQAFAHEADRRVVEALRNGDIERTGHPMLDRADAAYTILEHEAMHQETLLYMWHRLPLNQKRRPADAPASHDAPVPAQEWVTVDEGTATLGVERADVPFGWDNEFPAHREQVDSFEIQQHNVTNGEFMEFVEAGGYNESGWWRPGDWAWRQEQGLTHPLFWEQRDGRWYWRGMFELVPLPLSWPVYVSHAEATAFAKWRDARLPTEGEYQRAAYGTPGDGERPLPWGEDAPSRAHGVFDFNQWDPAPAGSHPEGRSAWGVDDLVGNGWEWTGTAFAPFPGFRAMATYPQYSADFFDGDHFVMKGASPATARELLRPSFRNWFRPHYPYVYATFRCARDLP